MRKISVSSIKEAFDNLPSGICFFDSAGMLVLINKKMTELAFALTGRDLQYSDDMDILLSFPLAADRINENTCLLRDGEVRQFSHERIRAENGRLYDRYIAVDITEIYYKNKQLEEQTMRQARAVADLERMNADCAAAAREEEVLFLKSLIHNEAGACILAARNYLETGGKGDKAALVEMLSLTSDLLLGASDSVRSQGAVSDLTEAARAAGAELVFDFPEGTDRFDPDSLPRLVIDTVREAVTNAIRHAGADRINVRLSREDGRVKAVVTNTGKLPDVEITEGSGLSSIRGRVERAGGVLHIESRPEFRLTVIIDEGGLSRK